MHRGHQQQHGGKDEHGTGSGHDVHPGPAAPAGHQPGKDHHPADQWQPGYPDGTHAASFITGSSAAPSSPVVGMCHGRNGRPRSTKTRENSS